MVRGVLGARFACLFLVISSSVGYFHPSHEPFFVFAAPKISEPIEGLRMHLRWLVSPASGK